jgi:hypothetical protein
MKTPEQLLIVVRHLGDLRDRVVFVGGMIRSLFPYSMTVVAPGPEVARFHVAGPT